MFNQPPPGLLLPPGQRGRQPLLSQPPPCLPIRGGGLLSQLSPNARAPHSQAAQWSASQSQAAYPGQASQNHAGPANQSVSSSEPRHPVANEITPNKETANQEPEKGKEGPVPLKSLTEAFIPMQVGSWPLEMRLVTAACYLNVPVFTESSITEGLVRLFCFCGYCFVLQKSLHISSLPWQNCNT